MRTPKALVKKPKVDRKPMTSRKSAAAKLVEEKHVGRLTTDWSSYKSHEDAKMVIYESLHHLSYFNLPNMGLKWGVEYAKKKLPMIAASLSTVDDWRVTLAIGSQCKLILLGAPFTEKQIERINNALIEAASHAVENSTAVKVDNISPAQRLKDKTSDFIAEVEDVIDLFLKSVYVDITNYSVYNELTKISAAHNTAKDVVSYYKPLLDELLLVSKSKKDEDIKHAYRHMTVAQLKSYISLVQAIISDAERYTSAKKAVRTVRKPKVKTAALQVVKLKLAKESAEFKVTSVDPMQMIGAEKLFLFDTKYRNLIIMESNTGFSVKGTTIGNVTSCQKKKLRKPDEVLSQLLKTGKNQTYSFFEKIKAKSAEASTRVNENMILVKVFK